MDTTTETKGETNQVKNEEVKKHHHKKKSNKPGMDTRPRAKSTLVSTFEAKKSALNKKDAKPIETIGGDKFKDLLSRFDKGSSTNQDSQVASEPKKLDMSRFSAFSNTQSTQGEAKGVTGSGPVVSTGIKERVEALLNSNKQKNNSSTVLDPVLEQRRKLRDEEEVEEGDSLDDDLEIESEEGDSAELEKSLDDEISEEDEPNNKVHGEVQVKNETAEKVEKLVLEGNDNLENAKEDEVKEHDDFEHVEYKQESFN